MTTESFIDLYTDPWLAREVNRLCAARSRRRCIRDEYRQEAWLWIGTAPGGCDREYYVEIAEKAVKSAYWQHRKDVLAREDREEIEAVNHLAIAHNLSSPPFAGDGFQSPCRPGSDRYTLGNDPSNR